MNPPFYRAVIPNGQRRAKWHDYRSRSIYMITVNKASGVPAFSNIAGIAGSHEWKPRTILTPLGEIVGRNLSLLKEKYPYIKILRRVIMPEHIHLVLFVTKSTEHHLGDIIAHFKHKCTTEIFGHHELFSSETCVSLFEEGYHDRILLKEGQLGHMLRYVSDNPRRRLERISFPDFHQRRTVVDSQGKRYETYGNIHLLEDPDLEPVRISRSFSEEELQRRKKCWFMTVENGGVLISPFISEAEKRVRDWALGEGGRIIMIIPNGFGRNYSPKEPYHTLCTNGRLLIIAPIEHSTKRVTLTRHECLSMNSLAEKIATRELHPL